MQRENDLQKKGVVVMGGSSGIGLAVAQQSALQGAKVVIVSSNAERVQKAVECISGEVQGQAVNVSDEEAVATPRHEVHAKGLSNFTTIPDCRFQPRLRTSVAQRETPAGPFWFSRVVSLMCAKTRQREERIEATSSIM